MRINLYLTPSQTSCSGSSSSSSSFSTNHYTLSHSSHSAPKPLLALCPEGELVLIELQGSLEMEGLEFLSGGQVAGEFSWGEGKEDKPTLLLSHHRLEGKLTTLPRPLAVLEKRKRRISVKEELQGGNEEAEEEEEEEEEDGGGQDFQMARDGKHMDSDSAPLRASSPDLGMSGSMGVNPLLEHSDEEDNGRGTSSRGASLSPTVQRRMKREHNVVSLESNGLLDEDKDDIASSLGPPLSSSKKLKLANQDDGEEIGGTSSSVSTRTPSRPVTSIPRQLARDEQSRPIPPSSSPAPLPPMRGSALDFSSPQSQRTPLSSSPSDRTTGRTFGRRGHEDQSTPTAKKSHSTSMEMVAPRTRQTATYYDVVCIVRKKVLFSKRPEPVVHGHGHGLGQQGQVDKRKDD